jgi:DNA-binding transcriptional ArsR family regulator
MVNYSTALDATFSALSDPTRREILARLADSPGASVSEVTRPFRMSKPAISKHLRILERAGLLARRKKGRVHHLRLVPAPLESAEQWLDRYRRFWEEKLDALDRYLRETTEEDTLWPPPRSKPRRLSASHAPTRPRAKRSSRPGRTRRP